jgi:hypothetical protein
MKVGDLVRNNNGMRALIVPDEGLGIIMKIIKIGGAYDHLKVLTSGGITLWTARATEVINESR